MGMVSLADKALAETFESADYVIVVRKRADGKNDLYRAHPGTDRKSGGRNLAGAGHQSKPECFEVDRFGRWARRGDALSGR